MDWFIELKKYRDSDVKKSSENYLSIAFTGLLCSEKSIMNKVLGLLFKEHTFQNPIIEVQEHIIDRNIPDIVIYDTDDNNEIVFVGVIECKLGAPPSEKQIESYRLALKKKYPKIRHDLIFLGRLPKPFFNCLSSNKVFCWEELLEVFMELNRSKEYYLINEFIKLMEIEGLIMPNKISNSWINVLTSYYNTIESIKKMILIIAQNLVEEKLLVGNVQLEAGERSTWYRGIRLSNKDQVDLGIYLVWWHNISRTVNLGLVVNIFNPVERINKLEGQTITMSTGEQILFSIQNENDWKWPGMRVMYEISESNSNFWNLESSDQIIYMTDIFSEILIKSNLCSPTPQH